MPEKAQGDVRMARRNTKKNVGDRMEPTMDLHLQIAMGGLYHPTF